jgi:hypothetical protein
LREDEEENRGMEKIRHIKCILKIKNVAREEGNKRGIERKRK